MLPAVAVVLVVGISKALTSAAGHHAMFLPKTLDEIKLRIFLLVRGCIAIFTLRGSDSKLYSLLSLGLTPGAGTILHKMLVGSWALALAATALFIARSRVPTVRFLVVWFAVHMLIVSAATGVVSRMFYLGAIPAALLSSWLLWRGAEYAAAILVRRLALQSAESVRVGLAFFALALLVSGATEEIALQTNGGVRQLQLARTYTFAPDGRFANGSQLLSLAELDRLAADPQTQVLAFDAGEGIPKDLGRTAWRPPTE